MPKTRQQIQEAATYWLQQAKGDLRNKINQVLQMSRTTPQVLADSLGVPTDQIVRIIHGDGNISLETFAKILIATDNAIQITPVAFTPIGGYTDGPQMEERDDGPSFDGDFPPIPEGVNPRDFRRMPPPPPPPSDFFARKPFGGETLRPMGGFRAPNQHRQDPHPHRQERPSAPPFASMSREELEKLITSKLWDNEIDIDNASRAELIRFLEEKDRRFKAMKSEEAAHRHGHHSQDGEERKMPEGVETLRSKLKSQLRKNPSLRSILEDLLKD